MDFIKSMFEMSCQICGASAVWIANDIALCGKHKRQFNNKTMNDLEMYLEGQDSSRSQAEEFVNAIREE